MNALEKRLQHVTPGLYASFEQAKDEIELLLGKYSSNFATYTDHSLNHTIAVFEIASELLSDEEINNLNGDEIYVLSMACLLHDVGMCIPEIKIEEIKESEEILLYKKSHPDISVEEFIRDIHHTLSKRFILHEWESLKIPSEKYANAIGLVAEGHRKVDISNFDVYNPRFFVKSGKEFICLPYLASILRIADELDVTNSRTPKILTKYYMPNNEVSKQEWQKHITTSQRNYIDDKVIFEVGCTDQNIYAALQQQFEKIQSVVNLCQKVIRSIPTINNRSFGLKILKIDVNYKFIGFDPKGIKFSFNVENVVTAFIGEDLYKDKLTSVREALQNSIDSCRYKLSVLKENYAPKINITLTEESIVIEDNGAGMDEFIIENYFGRLASSFYEQEKIKSQFEAIGQFGVGVFSYFLLCDYVDIETKTKTSKTLKFRFDKDPKSYFHFYDKTSREAEGTTITMFLKQEIQKQLTMHDIVNYIKSKFKHIEIDIDIHYDTNLVHIDSLPYSVNIDREIFKITEKKKINNVTLRKIHLENDEFEGECGLIVNKDTNDLFFVESNWFDHESFATINRNHEFSKVSFSQKGVFVNDYSSYGMRFLIGEVNIKKKIKINIDRNNFSEIQETYKILQVFECEILNLILTELRNNNTERKLLHQFSVDLIKNYNIRYYDWLILPELKELLLDFLHVNVYDNQEIQILSIRELLKLYQEFILISEKEDFKSIWEKFKSPLVLANGVGYEGTYYRLSVFFTNLFKLNSLFVEDGSKFYNKLSSSLKSSAFKDQKIHTIESFMDKNFDLVESTSSKMFVSLWKNKISILEDDGEYYFDDYCGNICHYFFDFLSQCIIEKKLNSENIKIVKAVIDIGEGIYKSEVENQHLIHKINEVAEGLNGIGYNYNFSKKDFFYDYT